MAKKGILERLKDGPVLGDGGYLLELERRGYVQAGPFTPEVAIEDPEASQLHKSFCAPVRRSADMHLLRQQGKAAQRRVRR
jgi:betaine-homocysteine S-methyltransferase